MSSRSLKLFPGLVFELLDEPPPSYGSRACDVCGFTVEGSVFHCREKGLDVHPTCAKLEETICVENVTLKLRKGKAKSKCIWCNQTKPKGSEDKIKGFRYESRCGDYSFHVFCLIDMERGHMSAWNGQCYEVDVSGTRMKRSWIDRVLGRGRSRSNKFVKVVKMFLTVVLSVLFGDPTTIIASVVVQLLT